MQEKKKRSAFHAHAVGSDKTTIHGWKVSSLALTQWTSRAQQPRDGSVCPTLGGAFHRNLVDESDII